jgi:hypothetical protein
VLGVDDNVIFLEIHPVIVRVRPLKATVRALNLPNSVGLTPETPLTPRPRRQFTDFKAGNCGAIASTNRLGFFYTNHHYTFNGKPMMYSSDCVPLSEAFSGGNTS